MNAKCRWSLWGAAFGCCFPLLAFAIRYLQSGEAEAIHAFRADPLLWIILTAPLFLGLFAALGGHQQDGLRRLAAELEQRVEHRTRELKQLTEHMTLIVNSMSDALVTVRLDGVVDGPPQGRALEWFTEPWQGRFVAAYLAPDNRSLRTSLELGLEQIRDDILPLELTLSQLPMEFTTACGNTFEIEYLPLGDPTALEKLLLVVTDITAEVASERSRLEQAEQQTVVAQALRDPSGFQLFRKETEALLDQLSCATSDHERKRLVHTLKGSSAVYGLGRLAAACQKLEQRWSEAGSAELKDEQSAELRHLFDHIMALVTPFTRHNDSETVRILRTDVLQLLNDVRREVPRDSVVQVLRDWSLEPVRPVLERLAAHAEQIAKRLGKPLRVVIEDHGVRLDLAALARFFQCLVHLVRNAVDHGIESPEQRRTAGKPREGTLFLRTAAVENVIVLEVSDDGAGIDWNAVRTSAQALKLPFDTPEQRVEALFSDGLSTARNATDISGRGVGLSAVKGTCDALDIPISVNSSPGQGTTLAFRLPANRRSIAPQSLPGAVRRRGYSVAPQSMR